MENTAASWLDRLKTLSIDRPIKIMNVCGGHERAISMAGLRAALPTQIELIPGPGCPVCVCPEEDVYAVIQIALHEPVAVLAFGDMLRVPVNDARKNPRSLEQAKAVGADIRAIASPAEAVAIAAADATRRYVFFAAGFETTTAPVAAMLAQGVPDNLLVYLSGRLTWPAVAMLLDSEAPGFDALIAPGHVATVMGPEEWEFVVNDHGLPAAVAGFRADTLLAAIYSVVRQQLSGRRFLDNCYPEAVRPGGNAVARRYLDAVMEIVDAPWRGVGNIPKSGYALRSEFDQCNARTQLPAYDDLARRRRGQMPPGCDCARVVLGNIYPDQCALYGRACTPRKPIGPCMVSDEGACRIWWAAGVRSAKPRPARSRRNVA